MCITVIQECPGPSQTCADCEGRTFVTRQHCQTCRPWNLIYRTKKEPLYSCEGRSWLKRLHCQTCLSGQDCPDYEEVIITYYCPPCRRVRREPKHGTKPEQLERKHMLKMAESKVKKEGESAVPLTENTIKVADSLLRLPASSPQLASDPFAPSPQTFNRLPRSRNFDVNAWKRNAWRLSAGLIKQETDNSQRYGRSPTAYQSPYSAPRNRSRSFKRAFERAHIRYPSPTLASSQGHPFWPYPAEPQKIMQEGKREIKRESY